MFVSEHKDERVYATVLYFVRKQYFNVTGGDSGLLDFKNHTVSGKTEEEAVGLLKNWIAENIGKDFSLKETQH